MRRKIDSGYDLEYTSSQFNPSGQDRPSRQGGQPMWQVTEDDLAPIAIGAGILGTGGGGNPYIGQLRARQAIRKYGPVSVLSPEELPDDAKVVCVGGIGAPTVGIEKIRDIQSYHAMRAIEGLHRRKSHRANLERNWWEQLRRAADSGGYGGPSDCGRGRDGTGVS